VGPIKCAVCSKDYTSFGKHKKYLKEVLVQIKYDTFVCKPCIAVWYNDWERMRNPWPHLGDDSDACEGE